MAAFEGAAVECFRPLLVNNNNKAAWDFCIVWKLGDDPSRFIEWRGCCCSGANISRYINVKEENGQELLPRCRDAHLQHPLRTEACKLLAKFPSSIPLYSGIHGEVVISKQPRWINNASSSILDEPFGTQVLIPVLGGLIELFSRKQVPKDQQILDFIMAQYISSSVEQEARAALSFKKSNSKVEEPLYCPIFDDWPRKFPATIRDPSLKFPLTLSKSNSYPSIEGSSTGSSLPTDLGSSHPSCNTSPEKSSGRYPLKRSQTLDSKTRIEASFSSPSVIANQPAENEDGLKARQRAQKESYQSKNLITERNRRSRIKNGLFTLRALVPNISKMDMTAIIGDAIEYIQELQKNVKMYEDELKDMEEEDCSGYNAEQNVPNSCWEHEVSDNQPATEFTDNPSNLMADDLRQQMIKLEVNQIGAKDILLRIIYKERQGGFLRLMQAMDALGLQVVDVNVITSNGSVLNNLRVEAKGKEIKPNSLKESLFKLLC